MTLLARRLVRPDYDTGPQWVETLGPAVAEFNADIGFAPDPQQEHALDKIFAIRPDGLSACFEYGCVVCRQNLKTGLFKQVGIGWLFVSEIEWFVWSAHEMSTTLESMREIHTLIADSSLSRLLPTNRNAGLYEDNNKTRIELRNGQRILFKARTQSGGRGLAAPKVILDEAFALRPSHVGSLLPALAAQEDPQVLYGSSAGKVDSTILRDIRDRGRSGSSARLGYDEWLAEREDCADPDCRHPKDAVARGIDCALDRERLRHKANPALTTGRISMETLDGLRQALPAEEFARECLGWWDDEGGESGPPAIEMRAWKLLADPTAPAPSEAAVVLYVAPDRSRSSIGLVGAAPEGKVLMMVDTKPGTAWVVPALVRLSERLDVVEVALHPSGQAGMLIPALNAAEVGFEKLVQQDVARGCAATQLAVVERRLVHLDQDELDAAVAVARTRLVNLGEVEVWDARDPRFEISPIVAGATALHRWDLYDAQPKEPPPPPRRVSRSQAPIRNDDIAHMGF